MVPLLTDVLSLEDPDVLGAFLSGAGPSIAVIARQNFERLEQLLSTMYAGAGHQAVVRTLPCITRQSITRPGGTCGRLRAGDEEMRFVAGLTCHLCGKQYPPTASWVCECLGPLEVSYDYAASRR
jgi:hypothetical protein